MDDDPFLFLTSVEDEECLVNFRLVACIAEGKSGNGSLLICGGKRLIDVKESVNQVFAKAGQSGLEGNFVVLHGNLSGKCWVNFSMVTDVFPAQGSNLSLINFSDGGYMTVTESVRQIRFKPEYGDENGR